ncbi:MAG TPA: hypothetical protein GX513_14345 [Firmicutes bacterium]|nr:hypothetical protein [Bacillota bacterium]
MKRYLNFDYLDLVWEFGELYDEQAVDDMIRTCAEEGFAGVLWRVSACGKAVYSSKVRTVFNGDGRQNTQALARLLSRFDPLAVACAAGARYGIEVWAWTTLLDDYYPGLESGLVLQHPEVQLVDREGKSYLQGVLCYAYPEVVRERLAEVQELAGYPVTGVYLCTRSHAGLSSPVKLEDAFGYNSPLVKEFQDRYGVDIRRDAFEKALWYDLIGEHFTRFILQAGEAVHRQGKRVAVGMRRNYYSAMHVHPLARMRFDWPQWVYEGAVDALVVGAGDDVLAEGAGWSSSLAEQYDLLARKGVELWVWLRLFDWAGKYGPHPYPDFPTKPAEVIREGVRRLAANEAISALAFHEAANVQLFDLWEDVKC